MQHYNVEFAVDPRGEKAFTAPDLVGMRRQLLRALSAYAAWRGVLARPPLGSHEANLRSGAVVAGLRAAIASTVTWIVAEREPHAYRSTPPFHFDRVFRTWQ